MNSTARADGSGAMFDAIADRYDLLNRINSLGMDHRWRRETVRALDLLPGHRLLDVATGTADLLVEVGRRHPGVELTGLDPSSGMLEIGRGKLEARSLHADLVVGSAEQMAFPDGRFDRIAICFGIRNVPDRTAGLREMHRVLAEGGRLAVLELSEPEGGPMAALARFHVRQVVPRVGALVSKGDEYRYLRASIEAFPRPPAFARMLEEAGFTGVRIRRFSFGACVLFVAGKE